MTIVCPGCGGPKTKRAQLCKLCRSRAIAAGVDQVITPDRRSTGQNSAFHGKCSTLAQLELGPHAAKPQLARCAIEHKRQALAYAAERFTRVVTSSTALSHDEMSEVLDWLDHQIAVGDAVGVDQVEAQ